MRPHTARTTAERAPRAGPLHRQRQPPRQAGGHWATPPGMDRGGTGPRRSRQWPIRGGVAITWLPCPSVAYQPVVPSAGQPPRCAHEPTPMPLGPGARSRRRRRQHPRRRRMRRRSSCSRCHTTHCTRRSCLAAACPPSPRACPSMCQRQFWLCSSDPASAPLPPPPA